MLAIRFIKVSRAGILLLFLLKLSTLQAQGIKQLFGAVRSGGTDGIGVINTLSYLGDNLQTRFNFALQVPGNNPNFRNFASWNGKLCGCMMGGSSNQGIIFEWDPVTNSYTRKFDFTGLNGTNPSGSLYLYNNKFYGTTAGGGVNNAGVLFEWDPVTNTFLKKIDFDPATGSTPTGQLAMYNSRIYGVTAIGGANNLGAIFEWDPATNVYTKKVDFSSATGAYAQYGGLMLYNNTFYGLNAYAGSSGQGTLYEWDPATNLFTVKHDFTSGEGNRPYGSLVFYNNKMYGTSYAGGSYGQGTIFEWNPATNIYQTDHSFDGTAGGSNPLGDLLIYNNKFYGLSYLGGANGAGVLFEWDPATTAFTNHFDFQSPTGSQPSGNLVFFNNKFYGATPLGGQYGAGVFFEWDYSSNTCTKKIDLNQSEGNYLNGKLSYYNGRLYGLTQKGGANDLGVIFEWDPIANIYTRKKDFSAADGSNPLGSMTLFSNNKFYGITSDGGTDNMGVLFEWDPASNNYTVKKNFTYLNNDGYPGSFTSELLSYNNKLYGLLSGGGVNYGGVLFEYDPLTNAFNVDYSFSVFTTTNGYSPSGTLAVLNNKLYGYTTDGGNNNRGIVFEWDPLANSFSKKADLSPATGYYNGIASGLVAYNNKLLGATDRGGVNNSGTILEVDPAAGTVVKKKDFAAYPQPSTPCGIPLVYKDSLYGFNSFGGANTFGAIYKYSIPANTFTNIQDLTTINGQYPSYGNSFYLRDALIAMTPANTCSPVNTITIDNTNNNQWVPITDSKSDVVAEIKANGSNLGTVSTNVYRNTGPVRDFISAPYCDRNITITPQTQPVTPVDIRLYITNAEFEALKNAPGSGISTINDVSIYKNNDPCYPEVRNATTQLATTRSTYDWGYVLSATINSFSSFFFTRGGFVLPLRLVSFTAAKRANAVLLNWSTANEEGLTRFEMEVAGDAIHFSVIGEVPALNGGLAHNYQYEDNRPWTGPVRYYRIRLVKADGKIEYSDIIPVQLTGSEAPGIYPNPAKDKLYVEGWSRISRMQLIDMAGRPVGTVKPQAAVSLAQWPRGIYILRMEMTDGTAREEKIALVQ